MKAFRVALASTGIGLIVVALGLLISNFEKVIEVVKKVIGWFGDFFKAAGAFYGGIFKGNKDLEKSNEDVEKSERKLAREHKKALRERERESRRVNRELKKIQKEYTDSLKENEDEYEKELLKLTLSNASTIEKNNALMDKLNKDYEAKINYLFAIQQKFVDESGKWTNKMAEITFRNLQKEAEKTQAQINALQKTNAEIEKSEADRQKAEEDAAERRREAAQREKERLQKLAEDYDNFTKQINETIKASNEAIEEMNLQKELSDLDTFSKIEKMRNVDLAGVEEWYTEQLNFLETYKNDKARYNAALIELEQAKVNRQAEINVKYDLELLAAKEKFEESYKKFIEEKEKEKAQIYLQNLKDRGENELYINESYRLKEQEIRQNYEELLKEAEAAKDSERLATLQAMLQAELDLLKTTKEAEIQLNLEAEKKMAEDSLKIKRDSMREQSFLMIDALSQIFNNMSQLSEKNARQQKTFAYISLALSQAKAMGEAIYGAMKMMNELPADPISKIAFFVGTLATFMGIITSTIMQAKQIASAGNMAGGGISSGVANNISSNYSAVQDNKSVEQQSQRVYVVESDITSTQNKIRKININQTL
jgi:CRISPR/Cas system-associated protein Cas5 (RAMP superfamily)